MNLSNKRSSRKKGRRRSKGRNKLPKTLLRERKGVRSKLMQRTQLEIMRSSQSSKILK